MKFVIVILLSLLILPPSVLPRKAISQPRFESLGPSSSGWRKKWRMKKPRKQKRPRLKGP